MNATLEVVLAFTIGYVVGAVPLGLIVARTIAGIDIRCYGTGNTGAANIRRNVGFFPAAAVALGIFLQGLAPTLILRLLGASEVAVVSAAVGAVVGYGWPVFLRFKGGRAVGVATGAAAAIFPSGFILLLLVYALAGLLRQIALGVLIGFVSYAAFVFYSTASVPPRLASLLLVVLIVARRLEGLGKDLTGNDLVAVMVGRLLFDWRPGQRLAGSIGEESRSS